MKENGFKVHSELIRDLSTFDVTMVGVGAMIGAGIFVLTGIAAGTAGPALLLSFFLNGIVTLFTAMTYAELGSAIPEAGGGYLWVQRGLSHGQAFLSGWMSWFAHAVAGSLYALGFASYFSLFFDVLGFHIPPSFLPFLHKILAALIIFIFSYINFKGVSQMGKAENIVTVSKILILLFFIGSGLLVVFREPERLQNFTPFFPRGITGVLMAMGLTYIAFEGYEIIVQAGEEVKNPKKSIPRAIFISLLIVIPIYLLVAFVSLGAVTPEGSVSTWKWLARHAELGVAMAARQFMPLGTYLLLLGGLLSTISALNATLFSSTRVSFAMGRDSNLPAFFGEVHKINRTPHKALLFSTLLMFLMAVSIPIESVAAATDIMFLLLFLQVNMAAISLRKKYGNRLQYGFKTPFFPFFPVAGAATQLLLVIFMFFYSPLAFLSTAVWLIAGIFFYKFYSEEKIREKEATPVILSEVSSLSGNPAKVLISISNPHSAELLTRVGTEIAREKRGSLKLLHVIQVPEQLPLSMGKRFIDRGRILLEKAASTVKGEEVGVELLIRVSHNVRKAVMDTIDETGVDYVVLGWRGDRKDPHTILGRGIEYILSKASCNVVVVETKRWKRPEKVLVSIGYLPQARLLLEMACVITRIESPGRVDLVHIVSDEAMRKQRREEVRKLAEGFRSHLPNLRTIVEVSPHPLRTIEKMSRNYDLVILGSGREKWYHRELLGTALMRLIKRLEGPVILVRGKDTPFYRFLREVKTFIKGES